MKQKAFTLLEILVVVTIAIVLMALLFPVGKYMLEAANGSACVANLRTMGSLISLYGAENQGKVPAPYDMGSKEYWSDMLLPYAGSDTVPGKEFGCPSLDKNKVGEKGRTYGMPRTDQMDSTDKYIRMLSVDEKGNEVLLVDSMFLYNSEKGQSYRIGQGNDNRLLHLRHNGRANVLFMDMHVEPVGKDDLSRLRAVRGVTISGILMREKGPWSYYDQNGDAVRQ